MRSLALALLALALLTSGAPLAAADDPPIPPGWPLECPPTDELTQGDKDAVTFVRECIFGPGS